MYKTLQNVATIKGDSMNDSWWFRGPPIQKTALWIHQKKTHFVRTRRSNPIDVTSDFITSRKGDSNQNAGTLPVSSLLFTHRTMGC